MEERPKGTYLVFNPPGGQPLEVLVVPDNQHPDAPDSYLSTLMITDQDHDNEDATAANAPDLSRTPSPDTSLDTLSAAALIDRFTAQLEAIDANAPPPSTALQHIRHEERSTVISLLQSMIYRQRNNQMILDSGCVLRGPTRVNRGIRYEEFYLFQASYLHCIESPSTSLTRTTHGLSTAYIRFFHQADPDSPHNSPGPSRNPDANHESVASATNSHDQTPASPHTNGYHSFFGFPQ
ncbi:hypothetical protein BV22DRAFT_1135360 [Leucogyrophana mollusca]|uniref:Uncharacterized protein n=1 Tax=Leucogyrophana mollusca TaxID=85980 RepID=A0ACB8AVV6_9AGAM|nr:hypothetical protein BV22DRAFT_1135360 [Leucogyrophana mollusca]